MPVSNVDCLIVGGGFTGLAAAHALARKGHSVLLLERDTSLGGLAGGFDIGGFELEKFYHHWFTNDTYVTEFANEIGAGAEIVVRATRTGMYYAGDFFRLSTPMDLLKFRALPLFDRVRTGLATLWVRGVKDWMPLEKVSARDWLTGLFGRKTMNVVWEPLLVGKFGKFADDISAVWFWKKLALRGSSRNKEGGEELAYFRGGFAALARKVGEAVKAAGGRIDTGTAVQRIASNADGSLSVQTSNGEVTVRSVLITTPLPEAADLLEGTAPAPYVAKMRRIKYLANVCLILELDRSLSETYWLNVNDPTFPFVGVIEHTNFEPPASYGGRHIAYLSKYLPEDDPLYQMNSDQMLAFAIPHLKKMFPAFEPSWVIKAHVWRAASAQPIVEKHYSKLIPEFETPTPNVFVSTMAQVYPEDRGTNYAIREGKKAAERISESLHASTKAVA